MSNEMLAQEEKLKAVDREGAISALELTPSVHREIEAFLSEKQLLLSLLKALGSPLNIMFPDLLPGNIKAFKQVFADLSLTGKIFYAHKANRSDSIAKRLSYENTGVDVASEAELKHALGCGFSANMIEATGPKNSAFLALALAHNISLNIDSVAELETIIALKETAFKENKVPILLRIAGAKDNKLKSSRFGIPDDEIETALALLAGKNNSLNFIGFSFHLDTVSIAEKCSAIEYCLNLFEQAYMLGLQPKILNIGGGFKVNYLAHQEQWHNYISALKEATLGKRPAISWHGNSFGLKRDKQTLRGSFTSYNYHDQVTGPDFLRELLLQELPSRTNTTIAQFLRLNDIEIWIEPGRSLLNQVGISAAKVSTVKRSSQGETLICLEMKRQDLCFLDQEFFVDPITISGHGAKPSSDEITPIYFAGNLCLESDLIYRHQTFVQRIPEAGDIIIFPNTAGYFMDFSACEAIMQPIAKKVAIYREGTNFSWASDSQYQPLALNS